MVEMQDNDQNDGKKKLVDLYDDCELKGIMEGIVDKVLEQQHPARF